MRWALVLVLVCGCLGGGSLGAGVEGDAGLGVDRMTGVGVAGAGAGGRDSIISTPGSGGSGGDGDGMVGSGGDDVGSGGSAEPADAGPVVPDFDLADVLEGRWTMTRTLNYARCEGVTREPAVLVQEVEIDAVYRMTLIASETLMWETGPVDDGVWYPDHAPSYMIWREDIEVTAETPDLLHGTATQFAYCTDMGFPHQWTIEFVRAL